MIRGIADAIWWGVVTITTVGYGDMYPITMAGRIFAVVVMLLGVVATSILSGTIASIFVARKIREGQGLQEVVLRGQLVICGWNRHTESILESLVREEEKARRPVVVVNQMEPEEFQTLQVRFPSLELRFVRGDFTNEKVLRRASIASAAVVVLASDVSGPNSITNADERTILGALAVKAINPEVTTTAELVNPENEPHLRRANVDDVLVNGEFNGFLLASSTHSFGIPRLVRQLLSHQGRSPLRELPIPQGFVGRTFAELAEHFLHAGQGMVIGLRSAEKKMSLEDILSNDPSGIDAFIKRKFMEAEINISEAEHEEKSIRVSPAPDYRIRDTDRAFVVARADGEEAG
jgi:voltage-gated potassium channel